MTDAERGLKNSFVYLIYTPPWVTWSAGIRVLHYLCDHLNAAGFEAYLAVHGPKRGSDVSEELNTPIINEGLLDQLRFSGRSFVAIYPESISGNPLNAQYVIRWILNFPKLLAGDTEFKDELVLAYSKVISEAVPEHTIEGILFIPALKVQEVQRILAHDSRKGKDDLELVYAQKFRALGGRPEIKSSKTFEITRFGKKSPDRQATLNLIHSASLVHVYENTTIVTEALLLGTPVICHKNIHFTRLIAEIELNMSGVSWDPNYIQQPNVKQNLEILKRAEGESRASLAKIFSNIRFNPNRRSSNSKIELPQRGQVTKHSLARAKVVFIQKGPIVFLRFTWNYLRR